MLRKLVEEVDDSNSTNLPWGNEWLKENKQEDSLKQISRITICNSGLLISCKSYKAYIYDKQAQYAPLVEAISIFAEEGLQENLFFVQLDKKGKPTILMDDEKKIGKWVQHENHYLQVTKALEEKKLPDVTNPFLAGRGVLPSTTVGSEDVSSGKASRSALKASRSVSNA